MAEEDMLIGVLPVGYNEGIGRDNNNRYVYINDNKYNVIGALGMNMLCIKIDNKVNINDKVMLMGDKITLGQMARFANRSIHEMLLNIGKSNKRVYVKNNKQVYIEEK
jgi:alanine racemase